MVPLLQQYQPLPGNTFSEGYQRGVERQKRNSILENQSQMSRMKLEEYEQNAPLRQAESDLKTLAANEGFEQYGRQLLGSVDPDAPDFDQQISRRMVDLERVLTTRFNLGTDRSKAIVESMTMKGYFLPETIRMAQVESGLRDVPEKAAYEKIGGSIVKREGDKITPLYESKSSATPTDIDDYVETFIQAYKDENNGKEPPAKDINKARLEFKRAQSGEVYNNTYAKGKAEADTVEAVSYYKKLGDRLAEIDTEGKLLKVKGELTPQEKQKEGRSKLSGTLKTMAGNMLKLDSMKAIPNTENTAFENLWAYTKASPPGQVVGRAVGNDEQAIRDSINAIRPTLINNIRQATDMSARAMDSNRELQFYLQAVGDTDRAVQSNLAAVAILDEKYGSGEIATFLKDTLPPQLITSIKNEGQSFMDQEQSNSGEAPTGAVWKKKNEKTGEFEYWDADGNKL